MSNILLLVKGLSKSGSVASKEGTNVYKSGTKNEIG